MRRLLRRTVWGGLACAALVVGLGAAGHGPLVWATSSTPPWRSERLAPEVVPAASSDAYAFTERDRLGRPVRYDPCEPITVVVNPSGAPPAAAGLVQEAITRTSTATGLVFEDGGTTDEVPTTDRDARQPERYGSGWAPVLVGWSDEAAVPELAGDVAGIGGSTGVEDDSGRARYVSGVVVLDAPGAARTLEEPDGRDQVRALVQHELAHVLGLDHVDDPTQLMNPQAQRGLTDFAAGDLAGLAEAGAGPCRPRW